MRNEPTLSVSVHNKIAIFPGLAVGGYREVWATASSKVSLQRARDFTEER